MDFRRPDAEVDIDEPLVRRLLAEQHPDLAGRTLGARFEGWDNVTWRLGPDMALRLPRRAAAADLLANEQRWLPEVAADLGVPTTAPVRVGHAGAGFPWPWSVVPWIDGEVADRARLARREAPRLADFLRRLHRPAPPAAPRNPFRSVPLAARAAFVMERIDALAGGADEAAVEGAATGADGAERRDPALRAEAAEALWVAFRAGVAARPSAAPVWIHGDLHPRNVLVRDGRLAGVIDWGDMAAGDPATDLASAWMLFADGDTRAALWRAYGGDADLRARARAWALFFGVALATTGDADHERMGRRILEVVAAG